MPKEIKAIVVGNPSRGNQIITRCFQKGVTRNLMPSTAVFLDKRNLLNGEANIELSRKTRARKHQHASGILSNAYTHRSKENKFSMTTQNIKHNTISKLTQSFLHLQAPLMTKCIYFPTAIAESGYVHVPSPLRQQIRSSSSTNGHCVVTDEAEFDLIVKEREFEMHRHPNSPIRKIVKLAQDATTTRHGHDKHELKVLDIGSSPIDPLIQLAKENKNATIYSLGCSREMMKVVSNEILENDLSNVITELSDLNNLSEFEDSSFDLVISCYGLQSLSYPEKLISDIHRVLTPGGTVICAVFEHLGTEPIVNKIIERVFSGKKVQNKIFHLTKPRVLEKMIEKSGLRVIDTHHGEYPLHLSTVDGFHGSAFDIVTLPIKKELGDLISSDDRPHAFEDAREAFDDILAKGHHATIDSKGRIIVEDNRYKIIVARRKYEDIDTQSTIKKIKKSKDLDKASKIGITQPNLEVIHAMSHKFDVLVEETFNRLPKSPFKLLIDSLERTIAASGHDDNKTMNILDLASHPNQVIKMMAETLVSFHDSTIHSVTLSPTDTEDMKKIEDENFKPNQSLRTVTEHQLKEFQDNSMDIVTCSFGLTRFSNPDAILKEVHRVLKPGGSFISTSWDSIVLERIGNAIMSKVLGEKEHAIPTPILNLSAYSAPGKLERVVESSGNLCIQKVEHFEFPFYLGSMTDNEKVFNNAILPIRHLLQTLEETDLNPNAFEDARRVFQELLNDNQLMMMNTNGTGIQEVKTVPNRFKLLVARRKFENADGVIDREILGKYSKDRSK